MKHIVDLGKKSIIPYPNWTVESQIGTGKIDLAKVKLELHLEPEQRTGRIEGNKLREKLSTNVLNANVLDYLLEHPHLIPEDWKGKVVYFWGTIYRGSGGRLCVRYLVFGGGRWRADGRWLDDDWGSRGPAVRSASDTLSSDTLKKSLDSLTLDSAIKMVKEAGYKIYKEI